MELMSALQHLYGRVVTPATAVASTPLGISLWSRGGHHFLQMGHTVFDVVRHQVEMQP